MNLNSVLYNSNVPTSFHFTHGREIDIFIFIDFSLYGITQKKIKMKMEGYGWMLFKIVVKEYMIIFQLKKNISLNSCIISI